jgi:hypothetical protein
MSKRRGIRNLLVLGIIAILISTTFIPAVSTHILNTESPKSDRTTTLIKNEKSAEQETIEVTCRIFEPMGVKGITREITVEQAESLSNFLKNAGDKEIAMKLKELNLLPKEMTIEQAQSMIKGKEHTKIGGKGFENNGNWYKNYLCYVTGFGVFLDIGAFLLAGIAFEKLLFWFLSDYRIVIPAEILLFLLLSPIYIKNFIKNLIPAIKFPLRPILAGVALPCSYIKTVGLNGAWRIEVLKSRCGPPHVGIFFVMGFTGIWIQFISLQDPDSYVFDWFSGFAGCVIAEELEI